MSATLATLRTAWLDSQANFSSFILQVLLMGVNDAVWVIFWGLFFHRVGNAKGWTFHDVVIMFSLLTVVAGGALGVFSNCRRIGRLISEGSLDETMVLPVSTLSNILCSRFEPSNFGDLIFGLGIFLFLVHPTFIQLGLFAICCLLGIVVMTGFLVFLGSLTFFAGGHGEHADIGFNALLLLSGYPLTFFDGPFKILLFTIVPAAFITGVPVELIRHFSVTEGSLLFIAATVIGFLALGTFQLGLKRYTSGSLWMRHS